MTGFPKTKKKKKLLPKPGKVTSPAKTKTPSPPTKKFKKSKVIVNVKKEKLGPPKMKQSKMERFITRTPKQGEKIKTPESARGGKRSDKDDSKELGKRSATLKAKNYR